MLICHQSPLTQDCHKITVDKHIKIAHQGALSDDDNHDDDEGVSSDSHSKPGSQRKLYRIVRWSRTLSNNIIPVRYNRCSYLQWVNNMQHQLKVKYSWQDRREIKTTFIPGASLHGLPWHPLLLDRACDDTISRWPMIPSTLIVSSPMFIKLLTCIAVTIKLLSGECYSQEPWWPL